MPTPPGPTPTSTFSRRAASGQRPGKRRTCGSEDDQSVRRTRCGGIPRALICTKADRCRGVATTSGRSFSFCAACRLDLLDSVLGLVAEAPVSPLPPHGPVGTAAFLINMRARRLMANCIPGLVMSLNLRTIAKLPKLSTSLSARVCLYDFDKGPRFNRIFALTTDYEPGQGAPDACRRFQSGIQARAASLG